MKWMAQRNHRNVLFFFDFKFAMIRAIKKNYFLIKRLIQNKLSWMALITIAFDFLHDRAWRPAMGDVRKNYIKLKEWWFSCCMGMGWGIKWWKRGMDRIQVGFLIWFRLRVIEVVIVQLKNTLFHDFFFHQKSRTHRFSPTFCAKPKNNMTQKTVQIKCDKS